MAGRLQWHSISGFSPSLQGYGLASDIAARAGDSIAQSLADFNKSTEDRATGEVFTEVLQNPNSSLEDIIKNSDAGYLSPDSLARVQDFYNRNAIAQREKAIYDSKVLASKHNTAIQSAFNTGNVNGLRDIYSALAKDQDLLSGKVLSSDINWASIPQLLGIQADRDAKYAAAANARRSGALNALKLEDALMERDAQNIASLSYVQGGYDGKSILDLEGFLKFLEDNGRGDVRHNPRLLRRVVDIFQSNANDRDTAIGATEQVMGNLLNTATSTGGSPSFSTEGTVSGGR